MGAGDTMTRTKMDSRGRIVPIKEERPTDSRVVNVSPQELEPDDVERFLIEVGPETRRELAAAASHQRAGQIKVGLFLLFAALDGGEMAGLHNNRTIDEIKLAMETRGSVLGERFKEMMRERLGDEVFAVLAPQLEQSERPALESGDDVEEEIVEAEVVEDEEFEWRVAPRKGGKYAVEYRENPHQMWDAMPRRFDSAKDAEDYIQEQTQETKDRTDEQRGGHPSGHAPDDDWSERL